MMARLRYRHIVPNEEHSPKLEFLFVGPFVNDYVRTVFHRGHAHDAAGGSFAGFRPLAAERLAYFADTAATLSPC